MLKTVVLLNFFFCVWKHDYYFFTLLIVLFNTILIFHLAECTLKSVQKMQEKCLQITSGSFVGPCAIVELHSEPFR